MISGISCEKIAWQLDLLAPFKSWQATIWARRASECISQPALQTRTNIEF